MFLGLVCLFIHWGVPVISFLIYQPLIGEWKYLLYFVNPPTIVFDSTGFLGDSTSIYFFANERKIKQNVNNQKDQITHSMSSLMINMSVPVSLSDIRPFTEYFFLPAQ